MAHEVMVEAGGYGPRVWRSLVVRKRVDQIAASTQLGQRYTSSKQHTHY